MPLASLNRESNDPSLAWVVADPGASLCECRPGHAGLLVVFAGAVRIERRGFSAGPVARREQAALLGERDTARVLDRRAHALLVGSESRGVGASRSSEIIDDPLVWWIARVLRGEMLVASPPSGGDDLALGERFTATLIDALLTHAYRRESLAAEQATGGDRPATLAAIRAMHDQLQGTFRVDRLAHELGVPSPHFGRRFKRATGMSPSRFYVRMRVAHAKQMLDEGAPVGDVWVDAGFYDQSHLSRHFKSVVGVSPTRFREDRGEDG